MGILGMYVTGFSGSGKDRTSVKFYSTTPSVDFRTNTLFFRLWGFLKRVFERFIGHVEGRIAFELPRILGSSVPAESYGVPSKSKARLDFESTDAIRRLRKSGTGL